MKPLTVIAASVSVALLTLLAFWLKSEIFAEAQTRSYGITQSRAISLQHKNVVGKQAEGTRVALVIGIGNYKQSPLRNPVNDARLLAKTLMEMGFVVTLVENCSMVEMKRRINEFGKSLAASSAGLFYYAGHGMQVNGNNYLIPVNSQIANEEEVDFEAVNTNTVLISMERAGCPVNIVILDACRDNPFARSFRSGSTRGLAFMNAPVGTLIAYATSPGKVAMDGEGNNSLYSRTLAQYMRQPGLKIEEVFKQVRHMVRTTSNGQQVPWESTSLEGDFFFNSSINEVAAIPSPPSYMPEPETVSPQSSPDQHVYSGGNASNEAYILYNDALHLKQNNEFEFAEQNLVKAQGLVAETSQEYATIRDERLFHLPIAEARYYLKNHKRYQLEEKIKALDEFVRSEKSHPQRYEFSRLVDELRTSSNYLQTAIDTNHMLLEKHFQMMLQNYWAEWGDFPATEQQFKERLIPSLGLKKKKYDFIKFGRNSEMVWAEFKDLEQNLVFRVQSHLM